LGPFRKLQFFGHVIRKSGTVWRKKSSKIPCQEHTTRTTHSLAKQHQDMDRAVVDGSSEGDGGPFTVEEDRPRCSETCWLQGGPKKRILVNVKTTAARNRQLELQRLLLRMNTFNCTLKCAGATSLDRWNGTVYLEI